LVQPLPRARSGASGDTRICPHRRRRRRAYEFTLTQGIARLGWINTHPVRYNQCEGCALGDLVALGIRLTDAGVGDYWDDVDSVVRNHLVEQQLVRADLLEQVRQGAPDSEPRSLGRFAGLSLPSGIPEPTSLGCCAGNGTQGLYYAWEGIVREQGDTAQVNLLLNRAARLLDVDSYLPYEGRVVLRNKAARRISVRIPFWVSRRDVRVRVGGAERPLEWVGNYLVLDCLRPGQEAVVSFPVRESTASYTVNANTSEEKVYSCTFRGSTLVDISPRDTSPTTYPLYLREHLRADRAPMKTVERFVPSRLIVQW